MSTITQPVTTRGQYWIRWARLIIAKKQPDVLSLTGLGANVMANTTQALDLSDFHFRFTVNSSDIETPNLMTVRVYNLQSRTVQALIKEFNQISLEVGYQDAGTQGMIFSGTVRRYKYGKENTTDNFLEILAGDNDLGYNFGFINTTLDPAVQAATWDDIYMQCVAAMGAQPDPDTRTLLANSGALDIRGRAMNNLARATMREIADSNNCRWSIQNGVLMLISNTGVRSGQAVLIGPDTGMISVPEATENGVSVMTLINPMYRIGTPVYIDSSLIVQTTTLNYARPNLGFVSSVSTTNMYRILEIDHTGDTRGQEWYSQLTCLALNRDLPDDLKAIGMV